MNSQQTKDNRSGADRDATSEELAREVPAEQSDDLFTDRGAQDVSSPKGDDAAENRVATSLDNE
jgi:hypothetical protein